MTEVRVAIVAITRHGAAIASRLAPQIPEAEVIVSEKQANILVISPIRAGCIRGR